MGTFTYRMGDRAAKSRAREAGPAAQPSSSPLISETGGPPWSLTVVSRAQWRAAMTRTPVLPEAILEGVLSALLGV
jgi:hypothetical protein